MFGIQRNKNSNIEIFNLMGFHQETGEKLLPITAEVVMEFKQQVSAKQGQADADAKEQAQERLARLFAPEGYAPGVVIVGARARQPSDGSAAQAAREVVTQIIENFRKMHVAADELRDRE